MIRNNVSMTVKTLKAMRDNPQKDTIDFNSPIQRKSGMWDAKRKSLLIHSILMGSIYTVPTVYFRKDMVADKKYQYSVIDGIQRLTSIFSYIDNEYPLEEVPPVILDGTSYDVSGKYFSDLEEDCRQEIIRFKLRIEAFEPEEGDTEEYVNDTIEEVFGRLNSAVPLTSAQLCKAKAGTDIAVMINGLLSSRFFAESASFTKAQLKAGDDQRSLIQGMMLLDRNYVAGFELRDFSETSLMEYASSIKGCYGEKQRNILQSAVEYLTDAFPEKNGQLKKINIPMLLYMADVAEDMTVKPMYFRQWWEYFTEEDVLFDDYKLFCSSGSTKLEKVNGRLAIMAKSFSLYLEIEIPEELKPLAEEAEERIAAMKEEEAGDGEMEEPETLLEETEESDADTNEGVAGMEETGNAGEDDAEDDSGQEEIPPVQDEEGASDTVW